MSAHYRQNLSAADAKGLADLLSEGLGGADGDADSKVWSPPESVGRAEGESPLADFPAAPPVEIEGYKIIRELSRGGQGIVYEALQELTRRKVALKVLLEGPYAGKSARRRFEREIELVAQLKHPNIITVFHSGLTPDGRQFCAMDYVRGRPLHKHVREKKLALEETLGLVAAVCDAVQYAHQRGVIHRDLKPSNIVVDAEGNPKILDFGLAKQMASPVETLVSLSQQAIGTLPYMSPEQAGGNPDEIDTRTDVYALGVIFYELLTGQYPYPVDGQFPEVLRRIAETAPSSARRAWTTDAGVTGRSTRRLRAGECPIDDEVETILFKALAKERERRYQSAGELARDIRHYLSGEPIEARRDSAWYVLRKTLRRHKLPVGAAMAFLLLIVASAVALVKYQEQTRRLDEVETERVRAVAAEDKARRRLYATQIALAQVAYNEGNVARMRDLLGRCPADMRAWEWSRLQFLRDRSLLTLSGHDDAVTAVAFSPDGRWVVSASDDRTLRLWDAQTGEQLRILRGHNDRIQCVAFTWDGKHVASGGDDGTVKLWDPAGGTQLLTLEGHAGRVFGVAFSPDGERIVSAGEDTTIQLWEVKTRKRLGRFQGHQGGVLAVAFSPDGTRIVSVGEDRLGKVWDASSAGLIHTLQDHTAQVESVAFSPDGTRIVSGGEDGTVKLWDAETGGEMRTFLGHQGVVRSVAFSPDGAQIVSASGDHTIKLWNAKPRRKGAAVPVRPSIGEHLLRRWTEAAAGDLLLTLRGHEDEVQAVTFGPDGSQIVSGSADRTLKLWDVVAGADALTLTGHAHYVNSLAISPDGSLIVSGSGDDTLKLWNAETGEELHTLYGHRGSVNCVAFGPDGSWIASGAGRGDGIVRVWDAHTGEQVRGLPGHEGGVRALAINRDGTRIVSADCVGAVRVWDARNDDLIWRLPAPEAEIHAVAFSPDGSRIVSGHDNGVLIVWDTRTGDQLLRRRAHHGRVRAVTFSPDAQHLVSASEDHTLSLWDAATGNKLRSFRGHKQNVGCVAFSPDGKRIVSGSDDRTLKLWDADTAEELLTLRGHIATVTSVAFSPDGSWLASASSDGMLRVWETTHPSLELLERRNLVAAARRWVDSLYAQVGFAEKVLAHLQTDRTFSEPVRQAAVRLVQSRGNNPLFLNNQSWDIVKFPGRQVSEYQYALRMAEAACEAAPDDHRFLNTLGVAQYRVGRYQAAIDAMSRAELLLIQLHKPSAVSNLAVIAMAQYRLGQTAEARSALDRARALPPGLPADLAVTQSLLLEAESLIPGLTVTAEAREVRD